MALAAGGLTGAARTGSPRTPADGRSAAVQVTADGCPDVDAHGGGTIVAPGRVLTSAHVVAGSSSVTVALGGRETAAIVVALDPVNDLAVLAVDRAFSPAAGLGRARVADRGVVMVMRAGQVTPLAVTVRRLITLQTEDIYLAGVHDRDAVELEADIEPGDSGSGVLVRGRVVAVVFARDRTSPHTAYGLDPQPVVEHIGDHAAVSTGTCARVG